MPVGVKTYFKVVLLTSDINFEYEQEVIDRFKVKNVVKAINPKEFTHLTDKKAGWYSYEIGNGYSDIGYCDFENFRRILANVLYDIPIKETFTYSNLKKINDEDFYNIINTIDTRCYILGKPLAKLKQDFIKHKDTINEKLIRSGCSKEVISSFMDTYNNLFEALFSKGAEILELS